MHLHLAIELAELAAIIVLAWWLWGFAQSEKITLANNARLESERKQAVTALELERTVGGEYLERKQAEWLEVVTERDALVMELAALKAKHAPKPEKIKPRTGTQWRRAAEDETPEGISR